MGIFSDFFGSSHTEYQEQIGFRPGVLGLDETVRNRLKNTENLPNTVTANRLAQISDLMGEEGAKVIKLRRLAQRNLRIQESQIDQLTEQANYGAESAKNQLKYRRILTKHSQNLGVHSLDVSLENAQHKGFQRELIAGSDGILASLGGW